MRFELVISGLCIVAVKSEDPKPVNPEALDIIVPDACHHKGRLIWAPDDRINPHVKPELISDTTGKRYGSFDLEEQVLTLSTNSRLGAYTVRWGEEKEQPNDSCEKDWMNWVPKIDTLGFDRIRLPAAGKLPPGASARVTLPFGSVRSQEIVLQQHATRDTDYIRWEFPAMETKADGHPPIKFIRVLANHVVYAVDDITKFRLTNARGDSIVSAEIHGPDVVRMCISNDMEKVPIEFNQGLSALDHLMHLDCITSGDFQAPQAENFRRTGDHICSQVVNVYDRTI
jgi:hypothetical protein